MSTAMIKNKRAAFPSLSDNRLYWQVLLARDLRLRLLRGGLCCFLLVLLLLTTLQIAHGTQRPTPVSVSDLLEIEHKDKSSTIYLADSQTGAIYSYALGAGRHGNLSFNDFSPLFKCAEFPQPTALAYTNGKLVVFDRQVPAIFEIALDQVSVVDGCKPKILLDAKALSPVIKGMFYHTQEAQQQKDSIKEAARQIKEPISIAISKKGVIALAGEDTERILWFDPNETEPVTPRLLDHEHHTDQPKRLIFNDSDLIVLNEDGKIYALTNAAGTSKPERALLSHIKPPTESKVEFSELVDFARYGNIYYGIDGKHIVVFLKAREKGHTEGEYVLPVFPPQIAKLSPARITVSSTHLLVADAKNRMVVDLPRPVPATVSLENDAENSTRAQLALYQYLFSRGLLPTREVITKRPYADIQTMIESEGLLLPGVSNNLWTGPPNNNPSLSRFTQLICQINHWASCATADSAVARHVEKRFGIGQSVLLPDIAITSNLKTSEVELAGKSVSDHLNERVLLSEQKALVDNAYLFEKNEERIQTPSALVAREGFINVGRSIKSLPPGTILTFVNGQQTVVGNVGDCTPHGENWIQSAPFSLPPAIIKQRVKGYLPLQFAGDFAKSRLSREDVKEVEVDFESAVLEKLSIPSLTSAMAACSPPANGATNYVVVEALKVPEAKYKFLRKNDSVVSVTDEDLRRWNISGRNDPEKQWSLILNEPLYLGVRLAELVTRPDQTTILKPFQDQHSLEPGNYREVMALTSGTLYLPATVWQLSILVNAEDLNDDSSELRQKVTSYKKVFVYSKQDMKIRPTGYTKSLAHLLQDAAAEEPVCKPKPEDPAACVRLVRTNRDKLIKAIDYIPPDPSNNRIRVVIVGIAEDSGNIKLDLMPFKDAKGQSAWFEKSDDCGFKRVSEKCSEITALPQANTDPASATPATAAQPSALTTSAPDSSQPAANTMPDEAAANPDANPGEMLDPLDIAKFHYPHDHGTFVASLIAARSHSQPEVSGLLPQIGLFFIDMQQISPDAFIKAIEVARDKKIRILNFSFEVENPTNDLRDVKAAMMGMKDMLFVVAAGDSNVNLRKEVAPHVPISWGDEVKTILGVGASDYDGNFVGDYALDPARPDDKQPISNYSKKYIQLIAPGIHIYSNTSENHYAEHSGSSYAAPQVTAAAAMLSSQFITGALQIKARLIYTADWNDGYGISGGQVWGGMLNYRRAVWEPRKNLVYFTDAPDIWAIEIQEDPSIKILSGIENTPGSEIPFSKGREIPFRKILRIQRYKVDNTWFKRVMYLEPDTGVLKIINRAKLESKNIRCSLMSRYVDSSAGFQVDATAFVANGRQEISINSINNYVAETPNAEDIGINGIDPW